MAPYNHCLAGENRMFRRKFQFCRYSYLGIMTRCEIVRSLRNDSIKIHSPVIMTPQAAFSRLTLNGTLEMAVTIRILAVQISETRTKVCVLVRDADKLELDNGQTLLQSVETNVQNYDDDHVR